MSDLITLTHSLFETLTVAQLLNKLPTIYETLMFVAVLTAAP
jgi:hypothetical protein